MTVLIIVGWIVSSIITMTIGYIIERDGYENYDALEKVEYNQHFNK